MEIFSLCIKVHNLFSTIPLVSAYRENLHRFSFMTILFQKKKPRFFYIGQFRILLAEIFISSGIILWITQ